MINKWEHVRTPEEVESGFQQQVAMLRRSLIAYDEGHFEEAMRIASSIYTLLQDPKRPDKSKTRSLLTQMGQKQRLQFAQTCKIDLEARVKRFSWRNPVPLCHPQKVFGEVVYTPIFGRINDGIGKRTSFAKWWKQPIFENFHGERLSRMELINKVRSQDGGGHFDPIIDSRPYHELSNSKYLHHFKILDSGFPEIAIEIQRGSSEEPSKLHGYSAVPYPHWARSC